jgi:hypothetical protein
MRIGFLRVVPLLALALCGCVQSPDWIEGTAIALDGGGAVGGGGTGGMGGVGGMGGGTSGTGGVGGMGGDISSDAGALECTPRLSTALILFQPLTYDVDRDGDRESDLCTYDGLSSDDAELRVLLNELIYTMDPPQPNPELFPTDRLCNAFDLRFRPWASTQMDFDPENVTKLVMCPRFCAALRAWVDEWKPICVPSGAP